MIYLDTHVLIFLYLGEVRRLGAAARKAIDRDEAVASAASVLELEMLHEIGRLKPTASKLVAALAHRHRSAHLRSPIPDYRGSCAWTKVGRAILSTA